MMNFAWKLRRSNVRHLIIFALFAAAGRLGMATQWFPFGPDGGDARAFAADPHDNNHLFLGTINGWIYDSHDAGRSWKRLARVGNRDDLALDNIVVDPQDSKHIIVGAWVLGSTDGGLFISKDSGATWMSNPELEHQSIRALTVAPSDPKILTAGTLKGVFRSADSGLHWKPISPADSTEIHEVESIAIDPLDPQTIYAGTWHLPWKTTDGGTTWNNIKQGIIEDSDVFSIIVDPKQPKVVYASACSGIYKSETGGEKFTKIQGIPATARRTRVLMQDPGHLDTVFAGTTEGLFRTSNAGSQWIRTTGPDLIVNDVYVDPANSMHVMLATDRSGVMTSDDGGNSFSQTNAGFSSRQVTSLASNARHPGDLYVGVVNDKQYGGVFISKDGGLTWTQHASGLEGHDVFSLGESADGTVVAGTEHGLYTYDQALALWTRSGDIAPPPPPPAPEKPALRKGAHALAAHKPVRAVAKKEPLQKVEIGISSLARVGDELYAATTEGVYAAAEPTKEWRKVEGPTGEPWRYVASAQSTVLLSSLKSLTLSLDAGKTWHMISLPSELTQIGALAVDDGGGLWLGGREGLFYSSNQGTDWGPMKNLYVSDVNSIYFDPAGQQMLVTASGTSTMAYAFHLSDKSLKYWDTGWNLRFLRPVGDYIVGVTMFDGVVLQPRMVQSKEVASH